jgi:ribosome biogenesis protein
MTGHQAQVSDVCFDETDSTVAYSTSWDHSLKTWDLTTSKCVDTRTTTSSLFSVLHLPSQNLVATGTAARHITLIDPRASAQTVSAMTLRGHTNMVVSLSQDPKNEYQFVSGSHDGTCRVWDVRSASRDGGERVGESVYVIEREGVKKKGAEASKVLGVQWDAEVGIVSGGEDMRVQINQGS